MRSVDNSASWRAHVLRDSSMTCSLATVHTTPKSCKNFANTFTASSWRRGRVMTYGQESHNTCPSVQQCVAVVAVCCLWRSLTSTTTCSTSRWTTHWAASVVSALSFVCLSTTNWTSAHDPTSSETCLPSTTAPLTFGRNLSALLKVRIFYFRVSNYT